MALGRFLRRSEQAVRPMVDELLMQRALDLAAFCARQHMECGVPRSMRPAFVRAGTRS